MTTSQVMIPAAVLARVGVSDRHLKIASDYDLYLRIAREYEFVFVKRVLTNWRYLPTSASGPAALRPFRCRLDEVRVLRKQLADCDPGMRDFIAGTLHDKTWVTAREAYTYGRDTDRGFARRFLRELWEEDRRRLRPLMYWAALHFPESLQGTLRALWFVCRQFLGRLPGRRSFTSSGRRRSTYGQPPARPSTSRSP
jgi:hypothetical protein